VKVRTIAKNSLHALKYQCRLAAETQTVDPARDRAVASPGVGRRYWPNSGQSGCNWWPCSISDRHGGSGTGAGGDWRSSRGFVAHHPASVAHGSGAALYVIQWRASSTTRKSPPMSVSTAWKTVRGIRRLGSISKAGSRFVAISAQRGGSDGLSPGPGFETVLSSVGLSFATARKAKVAVARKLWSGASIIAP